MVYLAAPSAAAAKARRTRCRRSSPDMELLPASCQPAYLGGRSIADPTLKDYFKKARAFLERAAGAKLDWGSRPGLDLAPAMYMDKFFVPGRTGDVASKTLPR